jgi:hypothetical protein
LRLENIWDNLTIYVINCDYLFIAVHNSAKVLVTHSEYTIYHEHLPGKLTQDGIADTIK